MNIDRDKFLKYVEENHNHCFQEVLDGFKKQSSGDMSIYDFPRFEAALTSLAYGYMFSEFADWNEIGWKESESEKMVRIANEFMNEIKYAPKFSISKSL